MAADVDQLMREMDALFAHMLPWRSDWQLIADLSMPGQSDILNLQTPGTNRTRHLYDSTMMWSLNTFVGHLTAWITNFQMLFFKYRMRALLDDQASSKWLDEISEITWSNMVANEAPQTTAVPETHRFSAGMGTGAMFLDAKPINPDDPSTG
ncbi:MAG: portal protein, partial [Gammaproteobacteria bacterium]